MSQFAPIAIPAWSNGMRAMVEMLMLNFGVAKNRRAIAGAAQYLIARLLARLLFSYCRAVRVLPGKACG
jgi:hypothetical protein